MTLTSFVSDDSGRLSRRASLARMAGLAVASAWLASRSGAATPVMPLLRAIPSSGETVPVVGLGSWITFNVGQDTAGLAVSTEVIRAFLAGGGRMIDSSPMYGSAQATIGHALAALGRPKAVWSADKVWEGDLARGTVQMDTSRQRWGVERFDLIQVHNLLGWQAHLPRLFEMKAAGRLRYVGISTSHGRRHADVAQIMRSQPLDFVQLTYNLLDRDVEQRLLPLARDRGIAVIVNRPFRQGALPQQLARHPLPGWARELGCEDWAQAALKFVVSHPDVTCAIPATTQVAHVRQNLAAGAGPMPDAALRARMAREVAAL
ncbi:aldo/keto reductase [Hydrogenophaga sp.]|uniref:aldo/keto reductase n=1 Tax=Hydrogenophaga sp. TaxID=1904254 RepID=UPI0025C37C5F|nr:aldo/keto reductase [Hydrogenophaga sp.]